MIRCNVSLPARKRFKTIHRQMKRAYLLNPFLNRYRMISQLILNFLSSKLQKRANRYETQMIGRQGKNIPPNSDVILIHYKCHQISKISKPRVHACRNRIFDSLIKLELITPISCCLHKLQHTTCGSKMECCQLSDLRMTKARLHLISRPARYPHPPAKCHLRISRGEGFTALSMTSIKCLRTRRKALKS